MKRFSVFFIIELFFPVLLIAQLPIPTPKFQPDTVYLVEKDFGLSYNIDRRHFFQYQYESFTKSTDENYYANRFTTSPILRTKIVSSRYFQFERKSGTGKTQIEYRLEDVFFKQLSEPVIFNVEIFPINFDSLSTRVNRSFFSKGIPGKKWVLLSIPNNEITLDINLKPLLLPLGNSNDTHRLYAIDEKGKTSNVTDENELFIPKLDMLRAYWFKTNLTEDKFHLKIPFSGKRGSSGGYVRVKGWTAFGTLVDYPINWLRRDDVRVWSFNPDTQSWREISELEPLYPWAGYIAYSPDSAGVATYSNFGVNYGLVNRSSAETVRKLANSFQAKGLLSINSDTLKFGFTSYSSDKPDIWDTPLLPSVPESNIEAAYFLESDQQLTENYKSEDYYWHNTKSGYDWTIVLPKGKNRIVLCDLDGFDLNSKLILTGKSIYREINLGQTIILNLPEKTIITLSIGDKELLSERLIPNEISLFPAYPNPFNPTSTISFSLPKNQHVVISLIDISGRIVKTLLSRDVIAGYHQIQINANELSSGIYFVRLIAANEVFTQKVLLVK